MNQQGHQFLPWCDRGGFFFAQTQTFYPFPTRRGWLCSAFPARWAHLTPGRPPAPSIIHENSTKSLPPATNTWNSMKYVFRRHYFQEKSRVIISDQIFIHTHSAALRLGRLARRVDDESHVVSLVQQRNCSLVVHWCVVLRLRKHVQPLGAWVDQSQWFRLVISVTLVNLFMCREKVQYFNHIPMRKL